ncbi:MAG: hypothetical protein QM723_11260 [Myxococcaceae bacterium]
MTSALLWLVLQSASIHFGEGREVDLGLALRASAWGTEAKAGAGVDFVVGSIAGHLDPKLKAQLAFAATGNGQVQLLDAVAMLEPSPYAKLWLGHFVPPSDRATLTGPFLSAAWDPVFVTAFPSGFAGRDDGAALWGDAGRFHYSAGYFRGGSWEGRAQLDLLDLEAGYYRPGSYYGAKRVISFGVSVHQVGGWSIDGFSELPGPLGVFDLEAAANAKGAYGQLSWMLRATTPYGRPQLWARYQWSRPHTRAELGLGWIVDGPFIRFDLTLARDEGLAVWSARLGVQLVL